MTTAPCSDPYGIGCVRATTTAIALTNSPHNAKKGGPCQKCRYRQMQDRRAADGKPPIRHRKGTGYDRL